MNCLEDDDISDTVWKVFLSGGSFGRERNRYEHFIFNPLLPFSPFFLGKSFTFIISSYVREIRWKHVERRKLKKCSTRKFISNCHEIWRRYNYHPFLIAVCSCHRRMCIMFSSASEILFQYASAEDDSNLLHIPLCTSLRRREKAKRAAAAEREMERCSSFRMFVEGFRLL